jgi:nitrite reductase (cytochrome c-552)
MRTLGRAIQERPWIGWLLFLGTILIVFFLGLITYTIVERRTEAQFAFAPRVEIDPYEPRPDVWGQAFPRQLATYNAMADTSFRSKYYGSTRIDLLERNPRLAILFAGYGFAKNYNTARGHIYSVHDVHETLRTGAPMGPDEGPQPATCWTCKSSDVPRLMNQMGPADFYAQPWAALGHEVINPISCANCHDPRTMNLRITQPALIEAYERQGRDITRASIQELRSLTCAQCHVEYYFAPPNNYLIFPWDEGTGVEDMERFKDNITGHTDWVHAISRAPMLKAQHPDYELFTRGIHYQRGVSCADCHMPYRVEGGVKYTDHRIQNPLNNVANACQTCHRQSEAELIRNVYDRQDAVYDVRTRLEDMLVRAHFEAQRAWELGATESQMQDALQQIRSAQWRWDYIAASHGVGFHAPQEALRVLGLGMDHAQHARVLLAHVLAQLGHIGPVQVPDISTKGAVMAFLDIRVQDLVTDKQRFMEAVLPEWARRAEERQGQWDAGRR